MLCLRFQIRRLAFANCLAQIRPVPLIGEFFRFGVVGTAGFLIDVAVLIGAMATGAGP